MTVLRLDPNRRYTSGSPFFCVGALWTIRRGGSSRQVWVAIPVLMFVLVSSSWLALETGEREEERVEDVVADSVIEDHEHDAERFLAVGLVIFAISGAGLAAGRLGAGARWLATVGSLVLVGVGWQVGHSGGELVYVHGAANAYVSFQREKGPIGRSICGKQEDDHDHDYAN